MNRYVVIAAGVLCLLGCGVEQNEMEASSPDLGSARQALTTWTAVPATISSVASDPGAAANQLLVRDSYDLLEWNERFGGSFNGWNRDTSVALNLPPAATPVKHPYGAGENQYFMCADLALKAYSGFSVVFRHIGDLGPDGCAWFTGTGYDWRDIGGSTAVEPALTHSESSGTHRYDVFTVSNLVGSAGKLQQSTSTGTASPTSPWTFAFSPFTTVPLCGGAFCQTPPTVKSGTAPAAFSWGPNRIDVGYVSATDSSVWIATWDGAWHDRISLGGVATSSPGMTSKGANNLEIAVRGTDYKIWRNSFNGTWSGWRSCGTPTGVTIAGKPALAVDQGVVLTYVRDTSNNLWVAQGDCF